MLIALIVYLTDIRFQRILIHESLVARANFNDFNFGLLYFWRTLIVANFNPGELYLAILSLANFNLANFNAHQCERFAVSVNKCCDIIGRRHFFQQSVFQLKQLVRSCKTVQNIGALLVS